MDIVPSTPALGAILHDVSLREAMTDRRLYEGLYGAWLGHLVLFFPDELLSNEEQLASEGVFWFLTCSPGGALL
ncbi:MAG: hypothetical protein ACI8Z1_001972 [Candidatus Azotimanducaceae bacterium]|jgi:hypothetical protein